VSSLTAHLRHPDDHGRLAFHPRCPICRDERLIGALSSEGVVTRRAQAVLAAGVLLAGGAVPATALAAAAPDQEQDGTAPPQTAGGDPAVSPNFDPGGGSTDLPFDAAPAPETQAPPDPGNSDTAPLDQEPSSDPAPPSADPGDGSQGPADAPQPAAPVQAPAAGQPDTTTPTTPPGSGEPAPSPGAATPDAAPQVVTGAPQAMTKVSQRHVARRRVHHPAPSASLHTPSAAPAPAEPTGVGIVPVAAPRSSPVASIPAAQRARPGDSSHVVLSGESLWSIAGDLLGGNAAPARVAREVHRLWDLNRSQIGTGDPDLLMVGTKLRLR
jgi:hypothetical protein